MLFRILLASALTLPLFAFDDDDRYRRNDRDRDGRWSRQDRDSRSRGRWERDNRRNDRYRDRNTRPGYGYGNNRDPYYGYGGNSSVYGRQSNSVVNRAMQNLQSAAARNRVDSHERDHFNRAMSELQKMRYNQGNVDSRSLSRVLEDLDHLSRADQVNPRDRQLLARDRQALASMYSGGYGYNRW